MEFLVVDRDGRTGARAGLLRTRRGEVRTPVFMPVGTAASVKAFPQHFLEKLGAEIILSNTYHLYLRPGMEVIRELGGLHTFMAWDRPILTDSGGYQVYSHRDLRTISEEGVRFRSHLDGSLHFLTPEKATEIQQVLGSDILMAFDDCTPYPVTREVALDSMRRSMRWAKRCRAVHPEESSQALFGIVQGSVFPDLRRQSLEEICAIGFEGVALGGFSVGEPTQMMRDLIEEFAPGLPADRPRYLMGVGTPEDLLFCIKNGVDMFDCVLPTRNARNGTLFTSRGKLRIKNSRYRKDSRPIDEECACLVCRRYSRAYLRHLFVSREILSAVFNTYHNLYFYLDLIRRIRESIALDSLLEFEARFRERYSESG